MKESRGGKRGEGAREVSVKSLGSVIGKR